MRTGVIHLLALSLFGGLASCDALRDASDVRQPPRNATEALERWQARDFGAYRFRFARSCYCAPAHLSATVSVRGDTVFAIDDVAADGTPIADTDHVYRASSMKSIEQLFEVIHDAEEGTIDSVAVAYDVRLGFPSKLYVDPLQAMADEEMTYSVRDVEPVDNEDD